MEQPSSQIEIEMTPETQELLSYAIVLIGESDLEAFMMSTAIEKANEIIKLSEVSYQNKS